MCGEQPHARSIIKTTPGSSPRVRGTEGKDGKVNETDGIIPACAGNSPEKLTKKNTIQDHPRVCGEQKV